MDKEARRAMDRRARIGFPRVPRSPRFRVHEILRSKGGNHLIHCYHHRYRFQPAGRGRRSLRHPPLLHHCCGTGGTGGRCPSPSTLDRRLLRRVWILTTPGCSPGWSARASCRRPLHPRPHPHHQRARRPERGPGRHRPHRRRGAGRVGWRAGRGTAENRKHGRRLSERRSLSSMPSASSGQA
jgi:hypothetical protein